MYRIVVVHHKRNTVFVFQRIPWPWRLHHACAPTDLKGKAHTRRLREKLWVREGLQHQTAVSVMILTCGGMIGPFIGSFLVPQSQVCPSPTKNPILIRIPIGGHHIITKKYYRDP